MKTSWLLRAARFAQGLVPLLIIVLLVFASALPWRLPAFAEVTPAFVVMAVFYWTIYRPDRLPYAATFCVGVLQDLLTGTPLGMTALILLAVQGVVGSQRTFFHGKPFLVVWWGFSLVMPVVGLVSWIIGSAYFDAIVPPLPIVVQVVLTVILFPVFAALFSQVRALVAPQTS
jgi:rod shape-determining protein MreD